nr:alpha/beta hydrolase [Sedimentibacter sp.]
MNISINNIDLWYEMKGNGQPFILLHGNSESHEIFDVLIEELSKKFTVYAIDSRDHGKSTRTNKLSYDMMVEDVASFINELKLEKPILYGFSDGGIVGLLLASKYPGLLSRLIVSGANTSPDSVKKQWGIIFKILYFIFRQDKFRMMLEEPNIGSEDLMKINIPVLVLAGENDLVKEENTRFIAENIPESTLRILEKENHMSYVVHSPKLYRIIEPFIENLSVLA